MRARRTDLNPQTLETVVEDLQEARSMLRTIDKDYSIEFPLSLEDTTERDGASTFQLLVAASQLSSNAGAKAGQAPTRGRCEQGIRNEQRAYYLAHLISNWAILAFCKTMRYGHSWRGHCCGITEVAGAV